MWLAVALSRVQFVLTCIMLMRYCETVRQYGIGTVSKNCLQSIRYIRYFCLLVRITGTVQYYKMIICIYSSRTVVYVVGNFAR